MTVTLKNKPLVAELDAALRRAGFKPGDQVEFEASGRVVTILPKLSPDELQDKREVRNPKIRAAIRKGYDEFRAGKTRPIGEFFVACAARSRKRPRRRQGA